MTFLQRGSHHCESVLYSYGWWRRSDAVSFYADAQLIFRGVPLDSWRETDFNVAMGTDYGSSEVDPGHSC